MSDESALINPKHAWVFTRPDTWTPTEVPAWDDRDEGLYERYMPRLGYRADTEAMDTEVPRVCEQGPGYWRLYVANDPHALHAYALLVVGAFDEMFLVWLPTFPDLLGYLSHYGASYGEGGPGAEVQRALDEMRLTLKRAFQAWHGHRGVEFCHECDPAAALAARRQAMYGVP